MQVYLFADLLRTRLQAEQPRRVQELHWGAAWSDEHGLDDDAVRQARRPPGATRPSANWDGPGNWPTWPGTKRAIAGPRPPVLDDLRLADGLTTLQNVVKHAQAGRVQVELPCDGGHAFLRVSDDGCGFAAEARPDQGASEGRTDCGA